MGYIVCLGCYLTQLRVFSDALWIHCTVCIEYSPIYLNYLKPWTCVYLRYTSRTALRDTRTVGRYSHHHPCLVSPPSSSPQYFPILVSYHLNKVSSCASQLNPGPISPPSRSHDQHPNSIWTPRFTFLFFHVESHLNPDSHICLPPPSRW